MKKDDYRQNVLKYNKDEIKMGISTENYLASLDEDFFQPESPEMSLIWKENASKELIDEFHQRCSIRLKNSNDLDWIFYTERFKDLKLVKNMLTIEPNSPAQVEAYRAQETERYKYPTKPWIYDNQDNSKSIVAPVLRKVGQATSKARDHPSLKKVRPAHVTILCLVRDATARLPDGVGTRADIC